MKTHYFNSITHNAHHINRYYKLINYFISNPPVDGEKHHIIPHSFGGSNEPDNIVLLPVRYHFIAHLILAKSFTSIYKQKAQYALWIIMNGHKEYIIRNSKLYAQVRQNVQKLSSERAKNRVTVRDSHGNIFCVQKTDTRYISGELIHNNIGKLRSIKSKQLNSACRLGKSLSEESISKRTKSVKKYSPCFYILSNIRYEFDYLYDCWAFVKDKDNSLSKNCINHSHNFYNYLKNIKRTHCGLIPQ
jgi:hypothetical protein